MSVNTLRLYSALILVTLVLTPVFIHAKTIPQKKTPQLSMTAVQADIDKTGMKLLQMVRSHNTNTSIVLALESKLAALCEKAVSIPNHRRDRFVHYVKPIIWELLDDIKQASNLSKPDQKRINSLWRQINTLKPYGDFYTFQLINGTSKYLVVKQRDDLVARLDDDRIAMKLKLNKSQIAATRNKIRAINIRLQDEEYADDYDDFLDWVVRKQTLGMAMMEAYNSNKPVDKMQKDYQEAYHMRDAKLRQLLRKWPNCR